LIGQRALVALALASGALAGVLYYVGAQRTPVVMAARDLDATHALVNDDLVIASLPSDVVPAGALSETTAAVGKIPRAPLWRGQVVLIAALSDDAAAFHTGLALPIGMRAVALPVAAGQAVGGAIVPGARIDVLAVPVAGRAPAGRTTELLLQSALVLDVRTETGAPHVLPTASKTGTAGFTERIGSVVIAIEPADEVRLADRIATSTFVLAFAGSR
jgi:Flp pilus assembly protein CpaB